MGYHKNVIKAGLENDIRYWSHPFTTFLYYQHGLRSKQTKLLKYLMKRRSPIWIWGDTLTLKLVISQESHEGFSRSPTYLGFYRDILLKGKDWYISVICGWSKLPVDVGRGGGACWREVSNYASDWHSNICMSTPTHHHRPRSSKAEAEHNLPRMIVNCDVHLDTLDKIHSSRRWSRWSHYRQLPSCPRLTTWGRREEEEEEEKGAL